MKEFTVDFPIAGWASVKVEAPYDSREELLEAIQNDEFDIPLSENNIMNWQPFMDIYDINWEQIEAPTEIEILD